MAYFASMMMAGLRSILSGRNLDQVSGPVGIYSATVQLAPGEYQYKFVIDGTWCADPENENSVKNDQGTFNSVVVVK